MNRLLTFFKKSIWIFILVGALLVLIFLFFKPAPDIIFDRISELPVTTHWEQTFDHPDALKEWKEHVFDGKSEYRIERDLNGEMALHARSKGAYSTIFKSVNIPLETRPMLAWQWRAEKFPSNKTHRHFGAENENDFAIRICAVFGNKKPFLTDIIQYVWDDHFQPGTHANSPYSKNVKMLVIRSGNSDASKPWIAEKRDLMDDYIKLFGRRRFAYLKAIAIISNSEDTRTESEAFIKRIWIESGQQESHDNNPQSSFRNAYHAPQRLMVFVRFLKKRLTPFSFGFKRNTSNQNDN